MKRPVKTIRDQQGQVAIIVAIVIGLLIVVVGLVVDLGYLYTRKTELQNAADAAALAGAKELNGTPGGIDDAVERATELLLANSVDFGSNPIDIEGENIAQIITFASSPSGPTWYSAGDAKNNNPADKLFIKVDTSGIGLSTVQTWFMRVTQWGFGGIESTSTFGMAVAGRTVCEALPIYTCAPSPTDTTNYGFVPGTSYYLAQPQPNKEIGPGYVGWMDVGIQPGADIMRLLLCRGLAQCLAAGNFRTLTQGALPEMMGALNTRFNLYGGVLNSMKELCPSDTNVKQYTPAVAAAWMDPDPINQIDVKWAAVRPSVNPPNYPAAPDTPYTSTSAPWFEEPVNAIDTQKGRRLLTIGIATNCPIDPGHKDAEIAAFARFLMQTPGVETSSAKGFYGEFIETVSNTPPNIPEIKLYR